jgi:release factor glutamine methyltransferase
MYKKIILEKIDVLNTETWVKNILKDRMELSKNHKGFLKYIINIEILLKTTIASRVLGVKGFWNDLFINKNVLDPRWDSEIIVKVTIELIKKINKQNILIADLGTGSGCLLLSIIQEINKISNYYNIFGIGVDICPLALITALRNKRKLNIYNCEFIHSDWLKSFKTKIINVTSMDIIISNPPYIDIKDFNNIFAPGDPHISLFADDYGMSDYESILSTENIKKDIFCVLEIFNDNYLKIKDLAVKYGWWVISLHNDLEGRLRCIVLQKVYVF